MTCFKTFVADGTAPNGRLYAGDLNAIQDRYADLVNFAQTHGVSVLQVGDTGLQIVKFGAGEFRMTGALRVDSILRALAGVVPGTFTTTQRNAIPANFAPTGIVIFNSTTGTIQWNAGTDAARNWLDMTFDASLMPTLGQKQALVGNSGSPSSSNKYVTEDGLADALGGYVPGDGSVGGDLSGQLPNPKVIKASGQFALPGVASASLGGDQHNFNPSGLTTAGTLRLTASGTLNITGLQGGSAGRILKIFNVGNSAITLKNENSNSSATNRFALGGDITLGSGAGIDLWYDSTSSRWRGNAPSGSSGGAIPGTTRESSLGSDMSMPNGGVWYDVATISLEAGVWLVNAHIMARGGLANDTTAGTAWSARITDGSVGYAGVEPLRNGDGPSAGAMSAIVTLAAGATMKLQANTAALFWDHDNNEWRAIDQPGRVYASYGGFGGQQSLPIAKTSKINAVKVA